jgi:DNA-binding response OmpR family regulator
LPKRTDGEGWGGTMIKTSIKKILVVDDEAKIVEVIKSYLENGGYEVYTAFNGEQALALLEQAHPALIILDLMLPDMSGEEICLRPC